MAKAYASKHAQPQPWLSYDDPKSEEVTYIYGTKHCSMHVTNILHR